MALIIQILILFIFINTIFKLSFWKWWQSAIFGLLCAFFMIFSCQWAILQSKTQLSDYLSNQQAMQNMAVLITLEAMIGIAFCFSAFRSNQTQKSFFSWNKFLLRYPGLLLFPALFYVLTQTIFLLPGNEFSHISYLSGAVVAIAIPGLSLMVKKFYPTKTVRLEIHFIICLFACIIGLITTVKGNVSNAAVETNFDIQALLLSAGIFLLFFITGIYIHKWKWVCCHKRKKN